MSKPRVLFVYDLPTEHQWCDGLWAALNLLDQDFEITRLNLLGAPAFDARGYDLLLGWGAFGSAVDRSMHQYQHRFKKALCIAGCATPPEGADKYDVLFYETKWYRPQISFHPNIVHAFGINTDIFSPTDLPTPIVWDYISVGAFAKWKRLEKLADKKGNKLAVGYYQDGNEAESLEIARHLIKAGVMVSNQVNPYDLANLYQWSRTAYIPAELIGGGERSVLEARACGLKVEIEPDNPKLQELLDCPLYDHIYYAAQLKKGILSVL